MVTHVMLRLLQGGYLLQAAAGSALGRQVTARTVVLEHMYV